MKLDDEVARGKGQAADRERAPKTRKTGRPSGLPVDGDRLKEARVRLGLTQEELERLSGVCLRTIQDGEASRRLQMSTIRVLAQALGLASEALLAPQPERVREQLEAVGRSPGPLPSVWWDRPDAVARSITLLEQQGLCCIAGEPGAGKSALAVRVVQAIADRYPDGVAWVACSRLFVPARADMAQRDLARAFGFDARLPRIDDVDREAYDRTFQAQLWKRPRVVVLDDVSSVEQVRHFLPETRHPHLITALIVTTSLRHVAESLPDPLVLEGLPLAGALELLQRLLDAGRVVDNLASSRRLAELVGGNPRLLHIAAAILRRNPYLDPGAVADMISSSPASLANPIDQLCCDDPDDARRHSISTSLAQVERHISREAWQLLGHLGVFGEASFTVDWAAAVGALPHTATLAALGDLTNTFILRGHRQHDAPMFRLDQHAALYARALGDDRMAQSAERLLAHALHVARTCPADPTARNRALTTSRDVLAGCIEMLAERSGVNAVTRMAPESVVALRGRSTEHLCELLWELGDWTIEALPYEIETWILTAFAGAERDLDRARMALLLGRYWLSAHVDFNLAARWTDHAANAFSACSDWAGAASASEECGRVQTAVGLIEEATVRFQRAVDLTSPVADPSGDTLLRRKNNLALTLTRRSDRESWEAAAAILREALEGGGSPLPLDVVRLNLATVSALIGGEDSEARLPDLRATAEAAAQRLLGRLPRESLVPIWLGGIGEVLGLDLTHEAPATSVDVTRERRTDETLWQLGEMAYYLRRRRQAVESGKHCSTTSFGSAIANVGPLLGGDRLLGLLFPLGPLAHAFELPFVQTACRVAEELFGAEHPVRTELGGLLESLTESESR